MGNEGVHAKAAEPGGMSSYSVRAWTGRDYPTGYTGLVFSKWLRSLRYGNDFFKLIDPDAYYEAYQQYIARILLKPDCLARFAYLSTEPDVVLGFSICRDNILDYVHVHKDFRQLGIGKHLIPAGIDTVTHLTRTGMTIWNKKYKHWKFNPFA